MACRKSPHHAASRPVSNARAGSCARPYFEPLRKDALAEHPWRHWAELSEGGQRVPGAQSRWSAGKDLSWEPVRIERVCEVKYDHMQGDRFRHAATFLRWRPDRTPGSCRYDQLDVAPPAELMGLFRG